jgi:hypothetical protein
VGAPSDDLFPVTKGLQQGENVVLNGNFLIDSQAHLSSGMSGLYGGSKEFGSTPAAQEGAGAPAAGGSTQIAPGKIEIHSDPDPMKASEDNNFQVKVIGSDGKAVTDANVTLTLIMPAMPSMGMPEMKSSVALPWSAEHAIYMGNGRPGMAGTWTVIVEARKNNSSIATLHTHLSAR